MSLYDKASLIFSGAAGAGNEEVAYNIKPVEKLKVDEYITNGGFDDGTTGWGASPSITVSSGKAVFDGSGYMALYQNDIFEEGKVYKISLTATIRKGQGIRIGTGENSQDITGDGTPITTSGSHSFYYTGQGGTNDHRIVIRAHNDGTAYDFDIDNVSVREVEQKANDFSFVRASDLTATYEGPDGLIKKTRENLIEYSNDFSKWTYNPSVHNAPVSGQTGYDGSTDAWLIDKVASDNSYVILPTPFNYTGVFTWSMYAKNESGANNGLHMYTPAGQAKFDLTGSGSVVSPSYANISATIESIGSGWFRCSFAADGTFTTTNQPRFKVVDTAGDNSTGKIYVQHAQLEQGLAATPYIHRTDSYSKSTVGIQEDEPRYDYSLDNALPPALLYEPERTNELKHSEHIKASFWSAINTITVTSNNSTSPEGLENATSVDGGDDYPILKTDDVILETSTDYVFSFYAKNVDSTDVHYRVYDEDLNTDIVSSTSYFSQLSTTEWNRIEVPFTTHSSSTNYKFYLVSGDMNGEILVWGSQVEKGSCVTSYIPTYGSAGTRKADTIPQYTPSKTNLDKYTFFAHSHSDRVASDNRAPRLKGDGNSALMGHFVNTAGKKQFFLYDNENNSTLSKATFGSFEAGDDTKYAFVVDNIALEAKLFIDGLLRETISLTERVDAKILSVGNSDGNPDRIKSIMYFPEALEDADAVSLTI